jgi:hypothetical protein
MMLCPCYALNSALNPQPKPSVPRPPFARFWLALVSHTPASTSKFMVIRAYRMRAFKNTPCIFFIVST